MTYILPLCAATINGLTLYILTLFKAARLSTKTSVASRLPRQTETCSGVISCLLVTLADIRLSCINLILCTITDAEIK
jgi:hypothetical protein